MNRSSGAASVLLILVAALSLIGIPSLGAVVSSPTITGNVVVNLARYGPLIISNAASPTTISESTLALTITLNSTLGPFYIETVTLQFGTFPASLNANGILLNGSREIACLGVLTGKGSTDAAEYMPLCPSTSEVNDPLGNPALAADNQSGFSPDAQIFLTVTPGPAAGQPVVAWVTLLAPVGSVITMTVQASS